jgi:hypothetical protein
MNRVEYRQVLAEFEQARPRHVLEWGSGGSTRALLQRFACIDRYVSIEHQADWYARVRENVQDPRLELHLVPATEKQPCPPADDPAREDVIKGWFRRCEDHPEIFADYVAFPRSLGISFDFVLVDGRARIHCLPVAMELLRPGGVVVLHDAQRPEYHQTIERLGGGDFLEPWRQGQICVIRSPLRP